MKILSKIARRHGGDALPDRRELVEMDLFDTDRNPWSPAAGGDGADELWTRHNYDIAVPFYVRVDPLGYPEYGGQDVGPINLVVARTSLAVAFVGGIFNVESGANSEEQSVNISLQATPLPGAPFSDVVSAGSTRSFSSDADGYVMNGQDYGWGWSVLGPGTYQVRLWAYVAPSADNTPVVRFTEFAATIVLLPAGLAGLSG